MVVQQVNSNGVVLEQLRAALGNISQENLARIIGCSSKKIWRGENGTETTWTIAEVQNLNRLLEENFGASIADLPNKLNSATPVPFLQEAIAQKKAEV